MCVRRVVVVLSVVVCAVVSGPLSAGPPIIEGYSDYQTLTEQLRELERHDEAALRSLGTTEQKREVWLLTVSDGDDEASSSRPAVLIVGSAHAPHLLGAELAVRIARRLLADDEASQELRRRFTFHVIPRPNPDASEAFFQPPYFARTLNSRPMDDDNDGRVDEDGPDDLNGDGLITMMRITEATGRHVPHPDDARVMVEADAEKDEAPQYRLMVEGRDNDSDGAFNEDPPGGVDFNRNFPFEYPFFEIGAGPHQVSEPETHGVAAWAMSQPNLALALTFDPADNLMKLWKSETSEKQGRIKTQLLTEDVAGYERFSDIYKEAQTLKNPPAADGEGSIAQWLYFHFGRWSLAARGWWIPHVKPDQPQKEKEEEKKNAKDAEGEDGEKKKTRDDKRGSDQLNALGWFDEQEIDGFVAWQEIEHDLPEFHGQKVEIGGIKPFLTLNPPAGQLDELAETHDKFLREALELLPRIEIERVKVDALGEDVYRITARVINRGTLPTAPRMGDVNEMPLPLQIQLALPEDARFIRSFPRQQLDVIAGHGGTAEQEWLVRTDAETGTIVVHSPSVGRVTQEVKLR